MQLFTVLTSAAITVALFASNTAHAQQYKFIGTDNSYATKLCVSAGNNNSRKLKSDIRRNRTERKYHIINNFQCNGLSMAKFAYKYDATDTHEFLNRYSSPRNRALPSVTIKDVALNHKDKSDSPKVIYVSSN